MDSYQARTEAAIEAIAEDAGYAVSKDASYGNVGTLRFHNGESVETLHSLFYSFQQGYATLRLDDVKHPTLWYYDAKQGQKTVADFLGFLRDTLS